MTQQLARRALSVAVDAAPHRAREGERRFSMASALPAARVLIGEAGGDAAALLCDAAVALGQTLAEPTGRVTDGFGHHRPVYAWLALHLLGTAARLLGEGQSLSVVRQAAVDYVQHERVADGEDVRLALWRRLVAWQHGLVSAEPLPLDSDEPAPLLPLGVDDLIDAWTYRELLGLHALHLLAVLTGDEGMSARARLAALYHLGHTQPDYTTYQPWGLAGFAGDVETAVFAEQQLHDVATHLSIEGPGGAVMPAVLLADASSAMSGLALSAWSGDEHGGRR